MTKKIAVHDTKYLCIERITFNTARSSPQLLLRMSVVNHYQINHQYLCLFTWRFIFGSFFFVAVVSFSSRLENSKTLKRFWCISNHCSVQNSDSGILRAMFGFKPKKKKNFIQLFDSMYDSSIFLRSINFNHEIQGVCEKHRHRRSNIKKFSLLNYMIESGAKHLLLIFR